MAEAPREEHSQESDEQVAVIALERNGKDEKESIDAGESQPELFSRKRKREDADSQENEDMLKLVERRRSVRLSEMKQELKAKEDLREEQKQTDQKLRQMMRATTVTECQQCMASYSRGGGEDERRIPYPLRNCKVGTQHYVCMECLLYHGKTHGFHDPPMRRGEAEKARGIPYTCTECSGTTPIDNTVFQFDRNPPRNGNVPTAVLVSEADMKRFDALIPDEKTSLERQQQAASHDGEMVATRKRIEELKQQIAAMERGEDENKERKEVKIVHVRQIEDLSLYQSHPISYPASDVVYDAVFVPNPSGGLSYRYYNEEAGQYGEYLTARIAASSNVAGRLGLGSITMATSITDLVPGHPDFVFVEAKDPITGVRPRPNRNANVRVLEGKENEKLAFLPGDLYYFGGTDEEAKEHDIAEIVVVRDGLVFIRDEDKPDLDAVGTEEDFFRRSLDAAKVTFVTRATSKDQDSARTLRLAEDGSGGRSISLHDLFPLVHFERHPFWTPLPGQPVWMWSGKSDRLSTRLNAHKSLLADVTEVIWAPPGSNPLLARDPGSFTVRVRERFRGTVHEFVQTPTDIAQISMEQIAPALTPEDLTRLTGHLDRWIELPEPVVTVFYDSRMERKGTVQYFYVDQISRRRGDIIARGLRQWTENHRRWTFADFKRFCVIVPRPPLTQGVRFRWSRQGINAGERRFMSETWSVSRIERFDPATQEVYFTETEGVFAGQIFHLPLHEFRQETVIVPEDAVAAVQKSGRLYLERKAKREAEQEERKRKEEEERKTTRVAYDAAIASGLARNVVFRWRSGSQPNDFIFVVTYLSEALGLDGLWPIRNEFRYRYLRYPRLGDPAAVDRTHHAAFEDWKDAAFEDWKDAEILPVPALDAGVVFRFTTAEPLISRYFQYLGTEVNNGRVYASYVDIDVPSPHLRLRVSREDFRVWVLPTVMANEVLEEARQRRLEREQTLAREQGLAGPPPPVAGGDVPRPPRPVPARSRSPEALPMSDEDSQQPGSRIVFDDEREPERGLSQQSQPGAPPASPMPPAFEPVPSPLRALSLSEIKEHKEAKEGKEREVKVAVASVGGDVPRSAAQDKPRRGDVFHWRDTDTDHPSLLLVTHVGDSTFDFVLLYLEDDPAVAPWTTRRPLSEWANAVRVPTPAPARDVRFRWAPWSAEGLDRRTYQIAQITDRVMLYRRFGTQAVAGMSIDHLGDIVTFPSGI